MALRRTNMASAVGLSLSALPAWADEAWLCEAREECRSTSEECRPLGMTFPVTISGTPGTLRMTVPERGALALDLAGSSAGSRVFSSSEGEVDYAVTLHDDGAFVGVLSETMFWGGVIDHRLTASCRRTPA